jgi:hypothetical protein
MNLFNKLLNELTEAEKNQLSDKQKIVLETLIGSKSSASLSSATLNDCVRPDGLALNIEFDCRKDGPFPYSTHSISSKKSKIRKERCLANVLLVEVRYVSLGFK